jgi:hypothetical protein
MPAGCIWHHQKEGNAWSSREMADGWFLAMDEQERSREVLRYAQNDRRLEGWEKMVI